MAGFGAKVKLTVDRSSKAEFNKQINSMVGQIKISNKFTVLQKDMDRVRKEAQAMLNSNPMTLKVNKIDCSAAVTNVKKQLQTMLSSLSVQNGVNITGLKDFLGAEGVDATMRSTADAANAAVQKMNEAKTAAASWAGQMEVLDSIAKSVAKTYKSGLSGSNMVADEAQIQRITAAYNEWARKVNEVKVSRSGDIEALQQEGLAIQRNITAIQDKQAAEAKAAAEAERAARAAENAAEREAAANQAELASLKQVASLQERMTKFLQSNSKLSYSDAGNSIRLMLTELRSGAEITTERLREMEGEFANIRTQATATGSLGRSMLDALSKAYERFGGWMLITRSLTTAIHTIKEMIANVRELDGALAQLQIVTGATDTQLTYFLQNATVLAKNLGKSITDVLGSIETFSRLGYNLEDATILAEYANVLANVAAVDTDAATTGMTSIIKGFNMDVEEAEHVADVLVEVGQKYAVSAGEMMERFGTLPTLITTIVGAYTAVKGAKGVSIGLLDFNDNKIQLANRGIGSLIKNFNAARESGARLTDSLRIGFNGALNNINQRIGAYNLQLGTSAEAQTLFMRNLEGTDSSLAAYLKSLNGGTASLKGYMTYCRNAGIQTNALGTKSKLAAVGVTVLNTALNMLITMGIALAIQAIISALGSLINAAEIASEKANQLASETREKAEANREELQTLNDLIEKYQELRKEEYVDSGTRAEVRNIQDEITKLVGDQANNLDLVNGKLDDEIDKLKQIALAEAGDTVDSYVAAYAAATNASDKAVGSSKGSFVHPAFGSWDYVGSGDNKAEEILRNAGYGLQVTDGGWFSNTTYVSTYGDANIA